MQGESQAVWTLLQGFRLGFRRLGFKASFGLKCKVGGFVASRVIKRYKAALKGSRF